MRRINIANQRGKWRGGKHTESGVQRLRSKGDSRKVRNRLGAPVDDAPIGSGAEIFTYLFESDVMVLVWSSTETAKKSDSIPDVRAAEHISIGQFTEDLAKGVAHFMFKSLVGRGSFWRSIKKANKVTARVRSQRDKIITITGF
jgi:hypothetical protein